MTFGKWKATSATKLSSLAQKISMSEPFPAAIDGFENTAERAYTGWPDRIYLIDANGRIAYKSRPGPFGFKPEELKAALGRLSSEQSRDQR